MPLLDLCGSAGGPERNQRLIVFSFADGLVCFPACSHCHLGLFYWQSDCLYLACPPNEYHAPAGA